MKKYVLSILIFILILLGYKIKKYYFDKKMYDVIIVGSGLSGLSAGYSLKDYSTLILEKNNYAGGRILTKSWGGFNYDLGAVFAYDRESLPFEPLKMYKSELIKEHGRIGIFYKKNLFLGNNVENCLRKVISDSNVYDEILRYKTKNTSLSDSAEYFLNAFFKVIHPGEISEYIYERKLDAFEKWDISKFESGNIELVEQLKLRFPGEIKYNSEVVSIEDKGDSVLVKYKYNDKLQTSYSKYVIITPPPKIAEKLIINIQNQTTKRFFKNLKYGKFIMATIFLKDYEFKNDFTYIVTPDLKINSVLKYTDPKNNYKILVACLGDIETTELVKCSDNEIKQIIINEVKQIFDLSDKNIAYFDMEKWIDGGVIISEKSYRNFSKSVVRPTNRTFLAGDYLFYEKTNPFPYGMGAAVASGMQTGLYLKNFLK